MMKGERVRNANLERRYTAMKRQFRKSGKRIDDKE